MYNIHHISIFLRCHHIRVTLSKLIYINLQGFVKVILWISRPLPNKTSLTQCLGCVVPLALFVWSLFLSHRVWTFGQNTWGSENTCYIVVIKSFHQKYLRLGSHNRTTTASNLGLQTQILLCGAGGHSWKNTQTAKTCLCYFSGLLCWHASTPFLDFAVNIDIQDGWPPIKCVIVTNLTLRQKCVNQVNLT